MRVAVFITPHGFGHAARASAVMDAVHDATGATFEIFTTVPRTFFHGLLTSPFRYHSLETDVGLRQASALEADLGATVDALDAFRSRLDLTLEAAVRKVAELECALTLSDISPLGVLVGEELGIPSVLVENFTWDWIYEPLLDRAPALAPHAAWFAEVFGRVDHRCQAAPVCRKVVGAGEVNPVARTPRRSRVEVRGELGLGPEDSVTLLTLGGVAQELPFLDSLRKAPGHFLITGAETPWRDGNLTFFTLREPVYTPDLIAASDRVVAKLGYSTAVEAWLQDRPLAFVANPAFRESRVLGPFVEEQMAARAVSREAFLSGEWWEDPWLRREAVPGVDGRRSGAPQVARSVAELLKDGGPRKVDSNEGRPVREEARS